MSELTEPQKIISAATQTLLAKMEQPAEVAVATHPQDPALQVVAVSISNEPGRLIGKNGQNILALEQLVKALVAKQLNPCPSLMLDINGYRRIRSEQLASVATAAASRVRASKKAEALEPMNAYERRIVHMQLAAEPDIETASIGDEPQRRVVIRPLLL